VVICRAHEGGVAVDVEEFTMLGARQALDLTNQSGVATSTLTPHFIHLTSSSINVKVEHTKHRHVF